MPLTVRLPEPLERALDAYCEEHGRTKSEVVQESLSAHLAAAASDKAERGGQRRAVSRTYQAFKRAGLIGVLHLDGQSATKDVIRARMAAALKKES